MGGEVSLCATVGGVSASQLMRPAVARAVARELLAGADVIEGRGCCMSDDVDRAQLREQEFLSDAGAPAAARPACVFCRRPSFCGEHLRDAGCGDEIPRRGARPCRGASCVWPARAGASVNVEGGARFLSSR